MSVQPGISVLINEQRNVLVGKRIGVFTNHTGVLPDLTSIVDALQQITDVCAIFSPEHGLYGDVAAGEHVDGAVHHSGVPIYSLYGNNLAPTRDQLHPEGAPLDVIVCDIQDIGCRFYTYVWTVVKLMQAAAQSGIRVIIADRPNPIGGAGEGPELLDPYRSLVGLHNVPVRHGLTLGELATLINREERFGCDVSVVPCAGWSRDQTWAATRLPWVPPSPNMPTPETALVYPGACLLEGINVSVGRGTAKPFEWLGTPWIDAEALSTVLNEQHRSGIRWRPVYFQPCMPPYAGERCAGVQPHVMQPDGLRPVTAGVVLVQTLWRLYHDHLVWNVAHFDRLAGSSQLRLQIEAGVALDDIVTSWQSYEEHFRARTTGVSMYGTT